MGSHREFNLVLSHDASISNILNIHNRQERHTLLSPPYRIRIVKFVLFILDDATIRLPETAAWQRHDFVFHVCKMQNWKKCLQSRKTVYQKTKTYPSHQHQLRYLQSLIGSIVYSLSPISIYSPYPSINIACHQVCPAQPCSIQRTPHIHHHSTLFTPN